MLQWPKPNSDALAVTATIVVLLICGCIQEAKREKISPLLRATFPSVANLSALPIAPEDQDHRLDAAGLVALKIRNAAGNTIGYCVRSQIVSRSARFKIQVLLDTSLSIKDTSVLSYRGKRGRDIRSEAFTSQFVGKSPADPLQLGRDIHAVTGATLSSEAMTEGVKTAIALLKSRLTGQNP